MTTMPRSLLLLLLLLLCLLSPGLCGSSAPEAKRHQERGGVEGVGGSGEGATPHYGRLLMTLVQQQSSLIGRLESDLTAYKTQVQEVQGDLTAYKTQVQEVQGDLTAYKTQVQEVQGDLTAYKTQVQEVQGDLTAYKTEVQGELTAYKTQVQGELTAYKTQVQGELTAYKAQVTSMNSQLQQVQRKMENASKPVFFTASMTTSPVKIGQQSPLIFNGVITNIGGGYNPHTGVFTAPVAGIYVFYAQLMKQSNTRYIRWGIYKSETALCNNAFDDASNYDKSSCLATVRLQKGDTVFVRKANGYSPGYTLHGSVWCSFSGFLSSVEEWKSD